MANDNKRDPVEEQRARQRELIELKRKKEEFIENPEEFVPEGNKTDFVQSRKSKLQNFWYYSRFTIAFILILAIIMTIGIAQCTGRTEYDMTVVMYFKTAANSTMSENLATVAEQYCEDYNKDGEVNVLVVNCSIPDDTRLVDTTAATRLLGQFQNEEAIVYIVDTGAYEDLKNSFGDDFLLTDSEMPDLDGTAFHLNGTIFDAAFNAVTEDYTNEFDYYLLRRRVSENATANKGDVAEHSRRADRFIRAVMSDPGLWNVDTDNTVSTPSASSNASGNAVESSETDSKEE